MRGDPCADLTKSFWGGGKFGTGIESGRIALDIGGKWVCQTSWERMTDLGPTTRELPALQDAVLAVVGTGDLGDGLGARDESTEETMSTGARIFGGEPMVILDGAVGGDPPGRRRRQAEEPAVTRPSSKFPGSSPTS